MRIEISIDGLPAFEGRIRNSGSRTVKAFEDALPISGKVMRWGDEIYFFVDFKAPLETDARSVMKVGEIAYWPDGPALAIFFGPTPASRGEGPVAASDCNVIGEVVASPEVLRKAKQGAEILISAKV